MVGRRIKDILPAVEQAWLDRYGSLIRTGTPIDFEEYNASLRRWFEVHASPMTGNRFVAVFSDITERKEAEAAVQTTLQRLYAVLSNMYGGLLLVADEVRVEFANQAICDYFDLNDSPADLVGLTSSEIFAKINKAYLYPDETIARIKGNSESGTTRKKRRSTHGERARTPTGFHPHTYKRTSTPTGGYGATWTSPSANRPRRRCG